MSEDSLLKSATSKVIAQFIQVIVSVGLIGSSSYLLLLEPAESASVDDQFEKSLHLMEVALIRERQLVSATHSVIAAQAALSVTASVVNEALLDAASALNEDTHTRRTDLSPALDAVGECSAKIDSAALEVARLEGISIADTEVQGAWEASTEWLGLALNGFSDGCELLERAVESLDALWVADGSVDVSDWTGLANWIGQEQGRINESTAELHRDLARLEASLSVSNDPTGIELVTGSLDTYVLSWKRHRRTRLLAWVGIASGLLLFIATAVQIAVSRRSG